MKSSIEFGSVKSCWHIARKAECVMKLSMLGVSRSFIVGFCTNYSHSIDVKASPAKTNQSTKIRKNNTLFSLINSMVQRLIMLMWGMVLFILVTAKLVNSRHAVIKQETYHCDLNKGKC